MVQYHYKQESGVGLAAMHDLWQARTEAAGTSINIKYKGTLEAA
jgi:hypothetical protein